MVLGEEEMHVENVLTPPNISPTKIYLTYNEKSTDFKD